MNKQKTNLIIDLILFAGFVLAFYLNLTGMLLHQWLGVIVCALALIHLLLHTKWVQNMIARFSEVPNRPLVLLLIDIGIAFGFTGILLTGLIISTWLNLPLVNYSTLVDIHVAFSLETLFVLLVKVAFHWRWISTTMRNTFGRKVPVKPAFQQSPLLPSVVPVRQTNQKAMSRRDFLAVMGVAGAVSWLALTNVLKDDQLVSASATTDVATATEPASTEEPTATSAAVVEQPASTATSVPTAEPTATQKVIEPTQVVIQQQATTASCVVLCNKHCSYPGRCRRYVDTNGNNLCDNGECM